MSLGLRTELAQVKDEPPWGLEWASADQHIEYEPESAQAWHFDHTVKAEICEDEEGECDVKVDLALHDLYKYHEVKDEVVLGPEVYQQSKVTLVCQGPRTVLSKTCSVRLELMCVDVEQGICRVGHNTYKFQCYPTLDNYNGKDKNSAKDALDKDDVKKEDIRVEGKTYTCADCNFITVQRHIFKRHVMMHTREKPYKCAHCSYTCNRRGYIKTHEMIHTGAKPYKCAYCEYTCSHKSYLKVHEMIHTREKPYKCAYCSYTCSLKSILKTHKIMEHPEKNTYKCTYCNFICRKKDNLKNHERTHNGEKPYKCSYCNYTCSQKGYLKTHERIHTGEKPFRCSYCSYSCSRKGHLKTHEMIHTGKNRTNVQTVATLVARKVH